jgi:hypothetical protein
MTKGDMMNAKKCNKKALAAAIGMVVVGLGAANSAQATAIAYAENLITNFAITSSAGSTISVTGIPTRNTINFATYGPTGGISAGVTFQNPVLLGSASDAIEATAGPGAFPGQNSYGFLAGTSLGMVGARGDSNTTAGSPFAVGGVPNVNNVAEARVTTGLGTAGASGGMNTANAAITFAVALAGTGTITFSFSDLYRYYATTNTLGEAAQGTIANIFTITNAATGLTVFNYTPAGININCASNSGLPATCDSGLLGAPVAFSGTSGLLTAGNYTVSLLSSSAATVTSVPEPGSILLLGLGLGAIGFTMRRRNEA